MFLGFVLFEIRNLIFEEFLLLDILLDISSCYKIFFIMVIIFFLRKVFGILYFVFYN